MRRRSRWVVWALVGVLLLPPPRSASTTFQEPTAKVWVNTSSGVYHCPGSQYWSRTNRGEYMTQAAARAAGHRPAYGKPCRAND